MTKRQVAKTIASTILGASPGLIWLALAPAVQPAIIAGLGAFIGFGFSLPGVSSQRIWGGVGEALISNVVPSSLLDTASEKIDRMPPPPPRRSNGPRLM